MEFISEHRKFSFVIFSCSFVIITAPFLYLRWRLLDNEATVKPVFFACPLFREFREPGKFAKITGRENLNTVAFQCSRKQKCQNCGVQNNYIDSKRQN